MCHKSLTSCYSVLTNGVVTNLQRVSSFSFFFCSEGKITSVAGGVASCAQPLSLSTRYKSGRNS